MQVRSLGFRTDLMLRRLAGAEVVDRGSHVLVRTPANPTFYWGNFLLIDPPEDGSARWLDEFQREFPAATHVAIGVDGVDGETGDVADLVAAGLELETSVVLTAERLDPPGRGTTVDVRPLVSDEDWRQMVAVRLDIDEDRPLGHREFIERKAAEARRLVDEGHGRYFGAFVDGGLRASLGIVTDGSGLARYQSVETHPGYRRRGLARALLVAAAEAAFAGFGAKTLVIVADPDYVAIDLYRALGFADAERQVHLVREPR
ncbi:MAG TPA: GNAT family N-acetyltransferase [Mycobacteriales bacterium]|nr:GNAT family N-acetyltransferase [Mycobacteriales bacterium]